ncbi:MAG: hypothetical protein JNL57_13135 [Bacteroidetes bacterium]|nr:hypothetical protein [Bacteroidota bacterium]
MFRQFLFISFIISTLLLLQNCGSSRQTITHGTVQWRDQYPSSNASEPSFAVKTTENHLSAPAQTVESDPQPQKMPALKRAKLAIKTARALMKTENPARSLADMQPLAQKALKQLHKKEVTPGDWLLWGLILLGLLVVILLVWLLQKVGLSRGWAWTLMILAVLAALAYLAFS